MSDTSETLAFRQIGLDTAAFFQLESTSRIRRNATIKMSGRSYLPKLDDLKSDWVASVVAPAFLALAQTGVQARNFCTIGTGTGLDALAAIEILRAENVIITDLHDDVVSLAQQNIVSNTLGRHKLNVCARVGDLLDPLQDEPICLDLLYENLPNFPISDEARLAGKLADGQSSSTFMAAREGEIPEFISRSLITLHHLALKQARPLLKTGGRLLSSIGGRIPLENILRLGLESGYSSEILTFTWKRQSEAEEVIGGYAHWEEQRGLGPFRFYPVQALAEIFGSMTAVAAGNQAMKIEQELSRYEMSACAALSALHSQMPSPIPIGHTVAVLNSVKTI